jgi:hypothetical protein
VRRFLIVIVLVRERCGFSKQSRISDVLIFADIPRSVTSVMPARFIEDEDDYEPPGAPY